MSVPACGCVVVCAAAANMGNDRSMVSFDMRFIELLLGALG
jgi:hypothetical protein